MASRSREVSVVLPAYNEAATIRTAVETTLETLATFLPTGAFEVIVAVDGCADETPTIAAELAAGDPRVRSLHNEERLGRGDALERAFRTADGDTLAYVDTDLATDMRHLEAVIESVRSGDAAFATGSRRVAGSSVDRPLGRTLSSAGYNALVRLCLRSEIHDHQCGFKAFDRRALFAVLEDVEDGHWFWDTEVLVYAQRAGYRVEEVPVEWSAGGETSVDFVRDVLGMGAQIVRTWWQLSIRPRITRRTSLLAGIALTLVAIASMSLSLDPETVLTEVAAADPVVLALATGVYATTWPLRGVRYRDVLERLGYRERVRFLTGAIFISQTGNLVFPARAGDAVRAYVVNARRGIPYATGFASLAIERVFDLLTITVLAGVVFLGLAGTGAAGDLEAALFGSGGQAQRSGRLAVAVAGAVGLAAFVVLGVIVASARSQTDSVRPLLARVSTDSYATDVAAVLERFVGDVQTVAADRRAFCSVGAISVAIWTLDVVVAVLVLSAFGVDVPLATLIAVSFFAVSVGNLAKVLPLTPGGIGLYEGAFTVLVVGLTPVTPAVALAGAVVDHALKNAVTVVGGCVSMLVLSVSLSTAVDEGGAVPDGELVAESPDSPESTADASS